MITLINSFSPNMLGQSKASLLWSPIALPAIRQIMEEQGFQSFMGQYNVTSVFSHLTGMDVRVNRKPYHMQNGDTVIQVQYVGPYFEDDEIELPEGGRLFYWRIDSMEYKTQFTGSDGKKYMIHSINQGV